MSIDSFRRVIREAVILELQISDPENRDPHPEGGKEFGSRKSRWSDTWRDPNSSDNYSYLTPPERTEKEPTEEEEVTSSNFHEVERAIEKFGGSVVKGDRCHHVYQFLKMTNNDGTTCPSCEDDDTEKIPGGIYCYTCNFQYMDDPKLIAKLVVRWIGSEMKKESKGLTISSSGDTITVKSC
jgi:hypothetical protein